MENSLLAEHHLRLELRPRAELEAIALARRLMAAAGMDERTQAEVQMAVIEAVINAAEHSESHDNSVDVYFKVTPQTFEVRVQDDGKGFDAKTTVRPDPQAKRVRRETRGWGLEIVRRSMDHVEIHSGSDGTTITMIKNR